VEKRVRILGFLDKGVLTILRDNLRVVMKRQQKPCIRAREKKIIKQNISALRLYFDFPAMCLPAKAKAVM